MSTSAKEEPHGEGSSSSLGSTPEAEIESFAQDNPGIQKRKGGRKPIYATSEERKQRNRQAQAAFRERRTEYIKQLETTIKHHEETLQTLQQSHRSAADECLMLRYKNSLLERILLEKGIDVQSELRAKTGSPHLGPTTNVSPASSGPPTMQRAIMNRHNQARRSASGITPKAEPGQPLPLAAQQSVFPSRSPQLQPTPPSHTSSPASLSSPGFGPQGVMTPPIGERLAQPPQQQRTQQPPRHFHQGHPAFSQQAGMANPSQSQYSPASAIHSSARSSNYYPPAPFQSHMEQLEQEYDAQADMLDDPDPSDQSIGPGPFQQSFLPPGSQGPPQAIQHAQQQQHQQQEQEQQQQPGAQKPGYPGSNQLFDPYDPALDADPFGLTASMTFPTPFTFETSSTRQ